ncbi:MAG: RtcB family protein [Candidatus Nanoarchaeia archaeon]|jgi:tRNA-splicing ligase RtcB
MELKKVNDNKWLVPKTSKMKVPAYVFASEKLLELMKRDNTLKQLSNVACLPGIYKHALCMPDGHQGYGFPIGGVAALDINNGGISPGGIGYDINCGVRLLRSDLDDKSVIKVIDKLISALYRNVPSGVGVKGQLDKLSEADLNQVLNEGAEWALRNGYATQDDLDRTEEKGRMMADSAKVSQKARSRGRDQLGSLGAGNHFLEIQRVDKIFDPITAKAFGIDHVGQVTVMIHCGSRGLGHQVCSDYIRLMEKSYPELINSLPDRELIYAPGGSNLANDYLKAMGAAANFAWCNRQVIAHQVRKSFNEIFGKTELKQVYDVCHNICKVEVFDGKKFYLHRKGATRCLPKGHALVPEAYKSVGQPALIPGTMGTASYIVVGLESCINESFASTAHGAGRLMSRAQASRSWTGESVQKSLEDKGITLKTRNISSVSDEAPSAYKDVDEVVRVSEAAGIAKRVVRLKPLGVIKG